MLQKVLHLGFNKFNKQEILMAILDLSIFLSIEIRLLNYAIMYC